MTKTIPTVLSTSQPDRARTATVLSLADAVKNYFAVWDRCGGDEAVSADEFAECRQAMRAALAAAPAVGWTPDPKAPWRCLICGSERSACTCLPQERPAVGGERATDILAAELRGSTAEFLGWLTGLVPPSDKESIPPEMRPVFEKMIGRLTKAAKRYAAQRSAHGGDNG